MNNLISLTVNGIKQTLDSVPGETLSTLLRERLRLTGTKIGCDEAECASCTVLVDGEPVVLCIYPAERADEKTILTIEGLAGEFTAKSAKNAKEKELNLSDLGALSGSVNLHPLQEAFVEHGAVQ